MSKKKTYPIIFLRVASMRNYKGITKDDYPVGAGSYVNEHSDGGEVYNFLPHNGKYLAYSRMQQGHNIRIERLGATVVDDRIKDVTVVLFATEPSTGGQYVVGKYENATLYRSLQSLRKGARKDHTLYNIECLVKNGTLIPLEDRVFEMPDRMKKGPGQANAWYVDNYPKRKKFLTDLDNFFKDPKFWIERNPKKGKIGRPRQPDPEVRKKVEYAAMDLVEEYYTNRGYRIDYVHKENVGWDMEAKNGKQTLLLEAKGLSGPFLSIELTPNEYANSQKVANRKHFRICVVSNALDSKKRKLEIFYFRNRIWQSNQGKQLSKRTITGAIFSPK